MGKSICSGRKMGGAWFLALLGLLVMLVTPVPGGATTIQQEIGQGVIVTFSDTPISGSTIHQLILTLDTSGWSGTQAYQVYLHGISLSPLNKIALDDIAVVQAPDGPWTLKVGQVTPNSTDPKGDKVANAAGWFSMLNNDPLGPAVGVGKPDLTFIFNVDYAGYSVNEFPSFSSIYVHNPAGEREGDVTSNLLVPEPSTLFLLGFALVGVTAYGWRSRQRG